MADLSVTAANVIGLGTTEDGTAGATITAGQLVYKDTTDANKFKLTDSDSATAAVREIFGVALNSASSGQPLRVLKGGIMTLNAVVTVGEIYVASDTAGGIMPEGDLEIGDYVQVLGIGTSTTTIKIQPINSNVAVAA